MICVVILRNGLTDANRIYQFASERRFGFSVERVIFAAVLQCLFQPGSDRAGERWIQSYAMEGSEHLDLHPMEVAIQYKQLWTVEDIFRTMKSILETRPIFHKCDDTIRGHVFCSFLALCMRKKLFDKLEKKNWKLEWEQIVQDVDALSEVTVTHAQKEFVIRTEARGVAGKVFQAAGVGLPPVLQDAQTMSTTLF